MAFYQPISGFIAQGWGRRPRRRRSTNPISINWFAIEAAPANGVTILDTVSLQASELVDMVQCVKWDNPIGAAVWLQSDSGDIIKLPAYSNGVQPILVGQGDKITAQLDPAYGAAPAAWPNTTVTLMSVPAEQAVYVVGSSFATFAGATQSHYGYFDDTIGGYRETYNFANIGVTNAAASIVPLPRRASDNLSTIGSVAITGFDISLTCTGIAAATNDDLIVQFSGATVDQGTLRTTISLPSGTPAPAFTVSRKGLAHNGQVGAITSPAIQILLGTALGAGTVTATGGIDLVLFP